MKAGLSAFQIQLLTEGPKGLSQAWILGAMHQDYNRMKGIKPPKVGQAVQTSLKEWLQDQKDQGV
jgi:hypothetical protein